MDISKHVLITGPAGSGKTTLAHYFIERGKNGIDADLAGIGIWLDKEGNEVKVPKNLEMRNINEWAEKNGLSWNWDENKLKNLLSSADEIYLIGGAANKFALAKLFDERYFLNADEKLISERIEKRNREGVSYHTYGKTEGQKRIILGSIKSQIERARKGRFEFIDASLNPKQIFEIICEKVNSAAAKKHIVR